MSGAMSRRKGARAEVAVVRWLRAHGFPTIERRLAGSPDEYGDTTGVPGLTIEIKDQVTLDLAGWVAQLAAEMDAAGTDTGVVIHKRRGATDVAAWYATLPVGLWVALVREAGYGDPPPIGDGE